MRPKDTEYQKRVKKAMKRLTEDINSGKAASRDILARNEILYQYIKYGSSPVQEAIDAAASPTTTGFEMIVNSMFQKAISGDVRAIKMILNMAGLDVDKVDAPQNEGANTFTLNYKLED